MRLLFQFVTVTAILLFLSGCAEEQYKGNVYQSHTYSSSSHNSSTGYQGQELSVSSSSSAYHGSPVSTRGASLYNGQTVN